MLTWGELSFRYTRQVSGEKKLPMRWLEKLHLDSPIATQPIRRVLPGAPDLGKPGGAKNLDGRKQPALGMQVSAQSAGDRRQARQETEEGYLSLIGARWVGRQL